MEARTTIVLIDDSPSQAKQIAAFMSQHDIDVAIAESARQGLRLIDVYKPQAIVMDLYMPVIDGFQLCRRLKRDEKTAHIPVIIVTASDSQKDEARAVSVGVDKFLRKDTNLPEHLLVALEELNVSA